MKQVAKKPFLGIIIAANTRAEAERDFVSVATGKSVQTMTDEGKNFMFMTTSESVSLMNPKTGAMDLNKIKTPENVQFVSSSSSDLAAHYTICADGCGSHIISESAEAVSNCPRCSSPLRSLSEEEIQKLNEEQAEPVEAIQAIVVASSSLEDSLKQYIELSQSKVQGVCLKDEENNLFVTVSAETLAFNPVTGSKDMQVFSADQFEMTASEEESDKLQAHYYLCANKSCSAGHVVSTSEDVIICPTCSSGLIEPDNYEGDVLEVEATLDQETPVSESKKCSKSEEDEDEEYDEDEEIELEDELEEDEDEDEDYEEEDDLEELESEASAIQIKLNSASSDDEDDDDEEDEDDEDEEEEEESEEDESEDDESEEDESEDDEEEEDEDSESGKGMSISTETLTFNGLELAESSSTLTPDSLHVSFIGAVRGVPTWIAMCGNVHVASANPITAAKHSDIFNSETFGKIVAACAKEHGVEFALKEMGFEVVSHDLQVPTVVTSKIDAEVTEQVMKVQASAQAELDRLEERYQAALSTALIGIDKNVWKGKTNPVKQALISSLSAVNVRNPELLVDSCFEQHGGMLIKAAMEKASELMDLTVEAQNEIASMVTESNYRQSSSIEQRLSSIASEVPVTGAERKDVAMTSESKIIDMSSILKTLGSGRR